MSISIKISMESYFESLNENDKLAFRKKLMLESSKTLPHPHSLRNDWIEDVDAPLQRCDALPRTESLY